jgi:hypothetical protein
MKGKTESWLVEHETREELHLLFQAFWGTMQGRKLVNMKQTNKISELNSVSVELSGWFRILKVLPRPITHST